MDLDKYSFIDERAIFDASHPIEKKDDITCLKGLFRGGKFRKGASVKFKYPQRLKISS